MKTFKIPVNWEVYGIMFIEAETIEEAIKKAENDETPYPSITDNTDGSLEVNLEIIEFLNPGEKLEEK